MLTERTPTDETLARPGRHKALVQAHFSADRHIRAICADIAACLTPNLAPYRLRLSADQTGINMSGDQVALVICEHVLHAISTSPSEFAAANEANRQRLISEAIEYALKHTLAQRLEGVLKPLKARSVSQLAFLEKLLAPENPIVFGMGPTGTGKTHLALAAAVNLLSSGKVQHIIVTRPHLLHDGETMTPEIRWETAFDTQFTPIIDILSDLTSMARVEEWQQTRQLQLIPTGLLQGRSFNNALILIDEAQNMDIPTMRMAVTRIGEASRMFVIGDPAQTVLRTNEPSGLPHLLNLVTQSNSLSVHHFEPQDIVRNEAVAWLETLYRS